MIKRNTRLVWASRTYRTAPQMPLLLKHRLAPHPLFEDAALRRLVQHLPAACTEYAHGQQDTEADTPARIAPEELRPLENVRAIGAILERGSVLIRIHDSPLYDEDYAAFLREYLAHLRPFFRSLRGKLYDPRLTIELCRGPLHVPLALNYQPTLTNQIRGEQERLYYPADVLTDEELEVWLRLPRTLASPLASPPSDPRAQTLQLQAGDTSYSPLYALQGLHMASGLSCSVEISFHSQESLKRRSVHLVNRRLRDIGMPVSHYGDRRWLDTAKHHGFRVLKRLLRREAPRLKP